MSDTAAVVQATETESSSSMALSAAGHGFRLLRLILVDAISPGKIVNFELDGGSVLTGDNGRGKTSYLNLIPLFYGANPNSLVSKGKDSFIEYYLPRASSYIAFEYQHPDGQNRMVVAYSNASGDKVYFRFVRQGFDVKMFVNDNGEPILNGHFRARLSELKIKCSQQQIETYTDYRAIIQYNLPKTGDRRHKEHIKDLCADYAFTRYNKALTNVDRLSLGMFSRTANFEVLQSIVVESIFDQQTTQSINVDRSKVENWPRNYRAYSDAMSHEPTFEKAKQDKLAIEENLSNLSELREQVALMLTNLLGRDAAKREDLDVAVKDRTQRQEAFATNKLELEQERVASDFARVQHEKTLQSLDDGKADYDLRGIAGKHKEFGNKKTLEQTLVALKNRYAALTDSHMPIVAKFESLKADVRIAYSAEVEGNVLKADAIRERCATKLHELDAMLNEQEIKLEVLFEEKRASLLFKLESLNVELGGCQQNLKNPQVAEKLIQNLEREDSHLTKCRSLSDAANKELRDKEASFSATKAAHDQGVLFASKQYEIAQVQAQRVKQIIQDNTPAPDTLLAFLREEVPGWKSDIARVIRPDILHRTDLAPIMGGAGDSFFGLGLKLDDLDARPESDVDYLAELIVDEERKLKTLQGNHEAAKEKTDGLERLMKKAETEKVDASKIALERTSALQVATSKKAKAQHEIEQAKKTAKDNAQRAFDVVSQRSAQVRQESQEHEARERSEKALRKTQRQNKEREIRAEEANELQQLANALKNKEIKRELDLAKMATECEQALKAEGVDAATLNAISVEVTQVEDELKRLAEMLPELLKWVPWEKDVYSTRPQVELSLQNESKALKSIQEAIADLETAYKLADVASVETIDLLEKTLKILEADRSKSNAMAEKLKVFEGASTHPVFDESWTADSLSVMMTTWLTDLAKNNKSLDVNVSTLRKNFEKYVNSGVHGFYDNYRQNHDLDKSIHYMDLFATWYESRHQEIRTLLRSTASVFSDEVVQFHQKLKTFTEHLARFNRDLQDGLETTNSYFPDISSLVVNIHSSVDELKSWGTIKSLVDSRASWINTESNLPGQDFLDSLEVLLGQWDVKNGITADFKHLVNIRGEVVEKGNLRRFRNSEEFNNLSSNGLSYLILIVLFVAFWKKIKKDSPVGLVWALDELKVISGSNIDGLMRMLNENNIVLASAFPDPEVTTLGYFRNAYTIDPQRRLVTYKIKRLGAAAEVQNNV